MKKIFLDRNKIFMIIIALFLVLLTIFAFMFVYVKQRDKEIENIDIIRDERLIPINKAEAAVETLKSLYAIYDDYTYSKAKIELEQVMSYEVYQEYFESIEYRSVGLKKMTASVYEKLIRKLDDDTYEVRVIYKLTPEDSMAATYANVKVTVTNGRITKIE